MYSGYGIVFDSAGSWSFYIDTTRNAIIFVVDNSSWYHAAYCKNDFLLREVPNIGIYENFGSPGKKFSIYFSKPKTKFCLSLHYNADNSYFFVDWKSF